MTGDQRDQRCIELVELLTAYMEDDLDAQTRRAFDEHLEGCPGCRAALDQWRTVTGLAGRLTSADLARLDPYLRERFLSTFLAPRRR
jgi:anti-sigma factor RsiW